LDETELLKLMLSPTAKPVKSGFSSPWLQAAAPGRPV